MVVSIGWNPFYGNTKKSFETHIIHKFDKDFYGANMGVVVCGYLRAEKNYDSLDALKGISCYYYQLAGSSYFQATKC